MMSEIGKSNTHNDNMSVAGAITVLDEAFCSHFVDGALDQEFERSLCEKIERWPDEILNDRKVVDALRRVRIRIVIDMKYCPDSDLFVVRERKKYTDDIAEISFASFDEFYNFVGGNINGADLHAFDFRGIDLRLYNIQGAYISSSVLISNGLYDDSFYQSAICGFEKLNDLICVAEPETVLPQIVEDIDYPISYGEMFRKIYYISDIHLNHRLAQVFPEHATEEEVVRYIDTMVSEMCSRISSGPRDFVLIAGDVSFSFQLAKCFYEILIRRMRLRRQNIVIVLGNHEIWDWSNATHIPLRDLEGVIEEYRKLSEELRITFLHNDLMILNEEQKIIIHENDILNYSAGELRELCRTSSLIILGGLGFSGLEPYHNATSGLYRQNLQCQEADVAQSKKFEMLYAKVMNALHDKCLIVMTHTPKKNWTTLPYNPNWIYVSGHTHQNILEFYDGIRIYADNQIGYNVKVPVWLKKFTLSTQYDIFDDYSDGIYTITNEEYREFNRGRGIYSECNRKNGQIFMLKRSGVYCFIFRHTNSKAFCLMSGGKVRKLPHNALEYYYNKMTVYYRAINEIFGEYNNALDRVSNCIKRIGGTGRIHGCIVDIDFYNHVFLDPWSGTLTAYHAISIVDKWVFKSVGLLLQSECPALYSNYTRLDVNKEIDGIALAMNSVHDELVKYVPDTDFYKPSRTMRAIQYMKDANVIRIWNDDVIEEYEKRYNQKLALGMKSEETGDSETIGDKYRTPLSLANQNTQID